MFAVRTELMRKALADPEFVSRLDGAKSMGEVLAVFEDWCRKNKVSVKHIEAST